MNHYEKSNFEVSNETVRVTVYYTSVKDDILILQMNNKSYLLLFIHMNTYLCSYVCTIIYTQLLTQSVLKNCGKHFEESVSFVTLLFSLLLIYFQAVSNKS